MNSREKGLVSLAVMAGATVALIFGSEGIYNALSSGKAAPIEATAETTENETEAAKTQETAAAESETEALEEATGDYVPGTYEASALGFGGDVKVAVTIGDAGGIQSIEILECSAETKEIGQAAASELAAAMVKAQDSEVDGVSGATLTSKGVKAAVAEALAEASEKK